MASSLRSLAVDVRLKAGSLALSVGSGRKCGLCGWTGRRFMAAGASYKRLQDSRCPSCRSLARHRMAYELLHDRIPGGRHTLHVAPEAPITPWLRGLSDEYLSIDLTPGRAMRAMSLTALELPDDSYDLIFCSHVLEHVPDDRAAMAELRRVLAPGGQAVILVPIRDGPTDDGDETTTTPEARLARFRHPDHVRYYGIDLGDRLASVGFEVEVLSVDQLPPEVVEQGTMANARGLFLCT